MTLRSNPSVALPPMGLDPEPNEADAPECKNGYPWSNESPALYRSSEVRILVLDDPWGPDWGPMFLLRLAYNDPNVWVDRIKNPEKPGDKDTYDLLVTYKQPFIDMIPDKSNVNIVGESTFLRGKVEVALRLGIDRKPIAAVDLGVIGGVRG